MSMAIQHQALLSMLPSPVSCSLWLEPIAHLSLRVLIFCPSLLGREGEEGGGKAGRGRGEREEQKDRDSASDERTRVALPGFTLYLCRRRVPKKKGHGAGAQSGSISWGI